MKARLKWLLKLALRREPRCGRDLRLPTERHGSAYGGWTLWTATLGPGRVVYSLGVGLDVTFDLSLIERFGVTVHAFDPTPESIAWIRAQSLPESFHFHPWGVWDRDGVTALFPPANRDHVSHSLLPRGDRPVEVQMRSLPSLMQELGHDSIDLLKMDIEGAEYEVLDDLLLSRLDVRQILVEFHHRFPEIGVARTESMVAKLRRAGYRVFDVSPGGEMSLVHRDVLVSATG